jgi:hypothetical protein
MGNLTTKMKHYPEVTNTLKKSKTFQNQSLKFHDYMHSGLNKFHDNLHYTAFPEEHLDENKKKELSSDVNDLKEKE